MGFYTLAVVAIFASCHKVIRMENNEPCDMAPKEPTGRFAHFCPVISKCPNPRRVYTTSFFARGCFCDGYCALYGDCCSEFTPSGDVVQLPSETFSCRRVDGVWSNNAPMYLVDKCPSSWKNHRIRTKCEQTSNDHLLKWPLSDDRNVTYKNLFCVKCNGKRLSEVQFWKSNVFCSEASRDTVSIKDLLKQPLKQNGNSSCNLTFIHPNGDNHFRNCKANIVDFCPPTWTDNCTRTKCESVSATVRYRFAAHPDRTFKNPYCALCHRSNVTCEDAISKKYFSVRLYADVYGKNHALSVSIDMNQGKITAERNGQRIQTENMTSCDKEHVYDAFSDRCRSTALTAGTVVIRQQNVDSTQAPSGGSGRLHVAGLLMVLVIFNFI